MIQLLRGLAAPNIWVVIFSFLAVAGTVCLLIGKAVQSTTLSRAGAWLLAPHLVSGLVLVLVVVPFLWARRRQEPRPTDGLLVGNAAETANQQGEQIEELQARIASLEQVVAGLREETSQMRKDRASANSWEERSTYMEF